VVRHLWGLVSRLNLSLVLIEEQTLDSELESLRVDNWGNWKGPVEVNSLVDLGDSLLFGKNFVHLGRHLGVNCILKLFDKLVTDRSHEQRLEGVCDLGHNVSVDLDADATLGEINISGEHLDSWDNLAVGESLLSKLKLDADRHLRDGHINIALALDKADLVLEAVAVEVSFQVFHRKGDRIVR